MASTVTAPVPGETHARAAAHGAGRWVLVAFAGLRLVVAAVAVPLAPVLYREERIEVLVLLRPSKEVLLLAGYVIGQGDASALAVVLAALPLLLGAVWLLFAVGRAFSDDLEDVGRNRWVAKVLPPRRIRKLTDAVCDRGMAVVFLGRLAAFPSTLVGAAAGASDVPTRRFLAADGAGALVSLVALLGAGYLLEDAYDVAGPWFTAAGVAVLALVALLLGRSLRSAGRARRGRGGASRR
jgi:membrane protein DedA with SNARE-associated domain